MSTPSIIVAGLIVDEAWVRTSLRQFSDLQAEVQRVRDAETRAQCEAAEARRRRDARRREAEALAAQVEALQLAVRTVSDERDRALRRLEVAEQLSVELQRRVTDLESAVGNSVAVLEESDARVARLDQELLEQTKLVVELRQVCAEQRHEIRCAAEREARRKEQLAAAPAEASRA